MARLKILFDLRVMDPEEQRQLTRFRIPLLHNFVPWCPNLLSFPRHDLLPPRHWSFRGGVLVEFVGSPLQVMLMTLTLCV